MEQNDYLIGRNTVREALKSGRELDMLFVVKEADAGLRTLVALAKQCGVLVKETPRQKLDDLSRPFGYDGKPANHQGVIAQVSAVHYASLDDAFAYAAESGRAPFFLAMDGVKDPHNLGAMVRSAEALGAHGVILQARRSASMTAAACKTACGAEEYIPIVRVTNLVRTLEELKQRGMWIAVADMDGRTAATTDLTGSLCLVVGAEGEGVSRLVREAADYIVRIDLPGHVSSLNASAAAAILLYEKQRQEAARV